jgi:hypothetical protein
MNTLYIRLTINKVIKYYVQVSGGYNVIPAPIGVVIVILPTGYASVVVSGSTYYYGGTYYTEDSSQYKVVAAPAGAVITNLPDGATEKDVDGQKYMVYNDIYYQPISQDGSDAYEVVEKE